MLLKCNTCNTKRAFLEIYMQYGATSYIIYKCSNCGLLIEDINYRVAEIKSMQIKYGIYKIFFQYSVIETTGYKELRTISVRDKLLDNNPDSTLIRWY